MNWIDRLSKKYSKYAPKHPLRIIMGLIIIGQFFGRYYYEYLSLDMGAIYSGQIWRFVTWLCYPSGSILSFILILYMCYWLGKVIIESWGEFEFCLYFIIGILLHIIIAVIIYALTGFSFPLSPMNLYLSMFLCYAFLYPNNMILLFFFIPLKSIWLGIVDTIFYAYNVISGTISFISLSSYSINASNIHDIINVGEGISALASLVLVGIFIYSGKTSIKSSKTDLKRKNSFYKNYYRKNVEKNENIFNKNKKNSESKNDNKSYNHKCEICGRTDISNPELEFRYCSKCNGDHEYCMDHLYTHEHK